MRKKQWIIKFVMMHKWTFLLSFIVVTIMTIIDMIYPFFNGEIINVALYEKDMSTFWKLCLIYVSILVFNQIFIATLNNLLLSRIMTGFLFDIRRSVFKKIIHKKGKDLTNINTGDIINRMESDTEAFVNLIFHNGIWGYSNFLHIVFAIVFMFYYNSFLGVFTVLLAPVLAFVSNYFKKKNHQINKKITDEQGRVWAFLFEFMKDLLNVKMLNSCKRVKRVYFKKTVFINKIKVIREKHELKSERIYSFIALVSQLLLFIICSFLIVNENMQIGVFVAAISYFNMATNYFGTIHQKIVDNGRQHASIQRVIDILNEEEEDYKDNILSKQIKYGNIDFKNVSFGYSDEKKILKNINLKINAGDIIGIVGKSGSGKTTLANLIYKLYDIDEGEIQIDNVNIDKYNLHSLRKDIGIVHQETIIYSDTLRYNLSFSNSKDNDEILIKALKKAALYDIYLKFPDGLNTVIGDNGIELSVGQKQRLAIARLFVKNPKILIFDEATASLDSYNESFIKEAITEMSYGRTCIIISHRLSTIKYCNKIAVLADGEIKGYDNHDSLMKSNSVYRDLFIKYEEMVEQYESN